MSQRANHLSLRRYQSEDDYWRMRRFLREVFLLDGRRSLSWPVTRLDYWRWHGILNLGEGTLENDVFLWETSEGELAAFTTIWYDDATRMGYYEPVGSMPQHQRRGLARALLCEGMHRLKQRGADLAIVGGESETANALYHSVFGSDCDVRLAWEKHFP